MVKQREQEDEQGVITVNGHSIDKQSVTVGVVKNHVTEGKNNRVLQPFGMRNERMRSKNINTYA